MATSKGSNSTKGSAGGKAVTTLNHDDAKRKNIPTAEYQSVLPSRSSRQYE